MGYSPQGLKELDTTERLHLGVLKLFFMFNRVNFSLLVLFSQKIHFFERS